MDIDNTCLFHVIFHTVNGKLDPGIGQRFHHAESGIGHWHRKKTPVPAVELWLICVKEILNPLGRERLIPWRFHILPADPMNLSNCADIRHSDLARTQTDERAYSASGPVSWSSPSWFSGVVVGAGDGNVQLSDELVRLFKDWLPLLHVSFKIWLKAADHGGKGSNTQGDGQTLESIKKCYFRFSFATEVWTTSFIFLL